MSLLGKSDYSLIPTNVLYEYAAKDADAARRIIFPIRKLLKTADQYGYYKEHTIPLLRNLVWTSLRGCYIDQEKLGELNTMLASVIDMLKHRMHKEAGEFNPNSPLQLQKILFEDMKFRVVEKTKTGAASTSKEVLEILWEETQDSFLNDLREYRSLAKIKSTYTEGIKRFIDNDSFIHPVFKIAGSVTGRVQAENPPVTTIPRDKEYSIDGELTPLSLRALLSAPKGYGIAYADYSQIELRVCAIIAGDEAMMDIFSQKRDPHDETARALLGIGPDEKVPKETRVIAKAINFGIIYCVTEQGLAASIGISEQEVSDFMQKYFNIFKQIGKFIRTVPDIAYNTGYLESPFGRRRHVLSIPEGDRGAIQAQNRQLVNYLPQGTAAELTARTFNRICKRFEKHKIEAWPINLVYDAIIVSYKKKYKKDVKEIMLEEMLRPVSELGNETFPCAFGFGKNWSDAESKTKDYF